MKPTAGCLERAATWAGIALSPHARDKLVLFGQWLVDEAVPAGGLGPGEPSDIECRHLADSITFGFGWEGASQVLDVGTGAGLPGIPLAIVRPHVGFLLADRSGRRCRLARRAARILDLDNLDVAQIDVSEIDSAFRVVVSRGAIPPEDLMPHLRRLVAPGGLAVVGGPSSPVAGVPGYRLVEIPERILDRPASLLIMAP